MQHFTSFALLLLVLVARGDPSADCFAQTGDDIKLPGTCTDSKVTLLSKTEELVFDIVGTASGEVKAYSLNLKIGGCSINGSMAIGNSEGSFQINKVDSLKLPITVTATKDSIKFSAIPVGKDDSSSQLLKCSPSFKKVDEGFVAEVDYSLSKPVPLLSITFKNARNYSSIAKKDGLPTWAIILIVVAAIICVLAVILVCLFYLFRWQKTRRLKRQDEEAARTKPAEKKPEIVKPAEKTPEVSKPVEKKLEPTLIVTKVDETKPAELKRIPKASKTEKAKGKAKKTVKAKAKKDVQKAHPAPGIYTDDGLVTANEKSFEKKRGSTESTLKTPDFALKRIDRLDMLEITARNDSDATTGATSQATSEVTTEVPAEMPLRLDPYKIPANLNFLVEADDTMKQLITAIGPQQRYFIYFNDACAPVFDACHRLLCSIEVAVKEGRLSEGEVAEFRREVVKIKELALDVNLFIMHGSKAARLPWSFKTTLEFGFLSNDQIDRGFNWDAPTRSQSSNIAMDLKKLYKLLGKKVDVKDSEEARLVEPIERLEELCRNYYRDLGKAQTEKLYELIEDGKFP